MCHAQSNQAAKALCTSNDDGSSDGSPDHVLNEFRLKCAELRDDGVALLAFLDSLAPPSELDIAEWHRQLWKACGGKEPCPFLPDDPGPRPLPHQDDCVSGPRQQVQWMAVHQLLCAMSSSAPSFVELLLGLRLCPGPEEQLAYIDQYRPQGTAYSAWAEALHVCLCKSQLLGRVGQEDPTPSGKQVMRIISFVIRKARVATWSIKGFRGRSFHHHSEVLKDL